MDNKEKKFSNNLNNQGYRLERVGKYIANEAFRAGYHNSIKNNRQITKSIICPLKHRRSKCQLNLLCIYVVCQYNIRDMIHLKDLIYCRFIFSFNPNIIIVILSSQGNA